MKNKLESPFITRKCTLVRFYWTPSHGLTRGDILCQGIDGGGVSDRNTHAHLCVPLWLLTQVYARRSRDFLLVSLKNDVKLVVWVVLIFNTMRQFPDRGTGRGWTGSWVPICLIRDRRPEINGLFLAWWERGSIGEFHILKAPMSAGSTGLKCNNKS